MLTDLVPTDRAGSFGRSPPPPSDQLAQVGVAPAVLRQQDDTGLVFNRDFGADDQTNPQLPCLVVRTDDAVNPVDVGQGDGPQTQSMGRFNDFLRMTGAHQKREVALAPKGNVT